MIPEDSHAMTSPDSALVPAVEALSAGKIILMRTQTLWTLVCRLDDEASFQQLLHFKREDYRFNYEILVDSPELLKKYIPGLSPRLETLLYFHRRPLAVLSDSPLLPNHLQELGVPLAFRVDRTEWVAGLIRFLGQGLWTTPAFGEGEPPLACGLESIGIEARNLAAITLTANDCASYFGEEAVLVNLDEENELVFLRE